VRGRGTCSSWRRPT